MPSHGHNTVLIPPPQPHLPWRELTQEDRAINILELFTRYFERFDEVVDRFELQYTSLPSPFPDFTEMVELQRNNPGLQDAIHSAVVHLQESKRLKMATIIGRIMERSQLMPQQQVPLSHDPAYHDILEYIALVATDDSQNRQTQKRLYKLIADEDLGGYMTDARRIARYKHFFWTDEDPDLDEVVNNFEEPLILDRLAIGRRARRHRHERYPNDMPLLTSLLSDIRSVARHVNDHLGIPRPPPPPGPPQWFREGFNPNVTIDISSDEDEGPSVRPRRPQPRRPIVVEDDDDDDNETENERRINQSLQRQIDQMYHDHLAQQQADQALSDPAHQQELEEIRNDTILAREISEIERDRAETAAFVAASNARHEQEVGPIRQTNAAFAQAFDSDAGPSRSRPKKAPRPSPPPPPRPQPPPPPPAPVPAAASTVFEVPSPVEEAKKSLRLNFRSASSIISDDIRYANFFPTRDNYADPSRPREYFTGEHWLLPNQVRHDLLQRPIESGIITFIVQQFETEHPTSARHMTNRQLTLYIFLSVHQQLPFHSVDDMNAFKEIVFDHLQTIRPEEDDVDLNVGSDEEEEQDLIFKGIRIATRMPRGTMLPTQPPPILVPLGQHRLLWDQLVGARSSS